MIWEYEPTKNTGETYRFEGPYTMTISLNGVIQKHEIQLAIYEILRAVEHYDGLDRIQELTHKTSNRVIWVVDTLSDERADDIMETSDDPIGDLKRSRSTAVMLPEDY